MYHSRSKCVNPHTYRYFDLKGHLDKVESMAALVNTPIDTAPKSDLDRMYVEIEAFEVDIKIELGTKVCSRSLDDLRVVTGREAEMEKSSRIVLAWSAESKDPSDKRVSQPTLFKLTDPQVCKILCSPTQKITLMCELLINKVVTPIATCEATGQVKFVLMCNAYLPQLQSRLKHLDHDDEDACLDIIMTFKGLRTLCDPMDMKPVSGAEKLCKAKCDSRSAFGHRVSAVLLGSVHFRNLCSNFLKKWGATQAKIGEVEEMMKTLGQGGVLPASTLAAAMELWLQCRNCRDGLSKCLEPGMKQQMDAATSYLEGLEQRRSSEEDEGMSAAKFEAVQDYKKCLLKCQKHLIHMSYPFQKAIAFASNLEARYGARIDNEKFSAKVEELSLQWMRTATKEQWQEFVDILSNNPPAEPKNVDAPAAKLLEYYVEDIDAERHKEALEIALKWTRCQTTVLSIVQRNGLQAAKAFDEMWNAWGEVGKHTEPGPARANAIRSFSQLLLKYDAVEKDMFIMSLEQVQSRITGVREAFQKLKAEHLHEVAGEVAPLIANVGALMGDVVGIGQPDWKESAEITADSSFESFEKALRIAYIARINGKAVDEKINELMKLKTKIQKSRQQIGIHDELQVESDLKDTLRKLQEIKWEAKVVLGIDEYKNDAKKLFKLAKGLKAEEVGFEKHAAVIKKLDSLMQAIG